MTTPVDLERILDANQALRELYDAGILSGFFVAKQIIDPNIEDGDSVIYSLDQDEPEDGSWTTMAMHPTTNHWIWYTGSHEETCVQTSTSVDDPAVVTVVDASVSVNANDTAGTHRAFGGINTHIRPGAPDAESLFTLFVNDAAGHDYTILLSAVPGQARLVMHDDGLSYVQLEGAGSTPGLTISDAAGVVTVITSSSVGLFGATPVAQHAAIPDATGGATIDTQARSALNTLLAAMRQYGIVHT